MKLNTFYKATLRYTSLDFVRVTNIWLVVPFGAVADTG